MRRVSEKKKKKKKRLIFGNEGARFGQDGAEGGEIHSTDIFKQQRDAFPARNSPTGCKRVYTRVYVKCMIARVGWQVASRGKKEKKEKRVCIESRLRTR